MNARHVCAISSLIVLSVSSQIAVAATIDVSVSNFRFTPRNITVTQGDTVRWTRVSGTHTVTSGTGLNDLTAGVLFDAAVDASNLSFSVTFSEEEFAPGTIDYFCRPHEFFNMRGTITVMVSGGEGEGEGEGEPAISVDVDEIDFGTVAIDSHGDRSLTVTNSGTGVLVGTAMVAAPFSVVSGATYSLEADEGQAVVVRFEPEVEGTATSEIALSGGGGATVTASGEGSIGGAGHFGCASSPSGRGRNGFAADLLSLVGGVGVVLGWRHTSKV